MEKMRKPTEESRQRMREAQSLRRMREADEETRRIDEEARFRIAFAQKIHEAEDDEYMADDERMIAELQVFLRCHRGTTNDHAELRKGHAELRKGLSTRTANTLYYRFNIWSREQALAAFQAGKLRPFRMTNYGWKGHKEVAKWLGLPEPRRGRQQHECTRAAAPI